ncbi:MAG: hypothetical protein AAFO80_10620 [Pseudomonadota bacterium]
MFDVQLTKSVASKVLGITSTPPLAAPIGAALRSGGQVSLPALRLIEIPFTDLPKLAEFAR